MNTCSCAFKEKMMDEMLQLQKCCPEHAWVTALFENKSNDSLCCLLTFLFYHAYCKECSVPLSEEARAILKPLMEPNE